MPKGKQPIVGLRYARLTVIAELPDGPNYRRMALCRCDCGKEIEVIFQNVRRGFTKSCGCTRYSDLAAKLFKHGGRKVHPEYGPYSSMMTRCYNAKYKLFHRYGGRGIEVCERWRNSFLDFLADMGPKPTPEHSLERKDNDGNYEPGNCVWIPMVEQSRNSSQNVRITYDGRTQILADWARETGIKERTIQFRIKN